MFLTALLMARLTILTSTSKQLKIRSLDETGFIIPPGRYGFVDAASSGIARRASIELEAGLSALERLGDPETLTSTAEYAGRRLVRINGGFLVLNFAKYRDKDHTAAERAKRYRKRKADASPGESTYVAAAEAGASETQLNNIVTESLPTKLQ